MSSWAALKEHIAATAGAAPSHALAQVRWLFGRYAAAKIARRPGAGRLVPRQMAGRSRRLAVPAGAPARPQ